MTQAVRGAGGKAGSGGKVIKDNLFADSTAYVLGLISEGEIEGLSNQDVPESCIFLDGVPIKNEDGTVNIEGVEWWIRNGTPDQDVIPGFSAIENEVDVGVTVEQAAPIERTISSEDVDAARVKVSFPALVHVKDNGDRLGAEVAFSIDIKAGAAAYETVLETTVSGKTTTGYQRAYRIELPEVRPVTIRVTRITDDSDKEELQNEMQLASITEIVDAKLSYPDCALLGLAVPASSVGGAVSQVSVKIKGIKCLVPTNYDAVARTYDETTMWDGTFKVAWTRNPVWANFTTCVNERWGLGHRIAVETVDKWTAYQQAKYSDELVPDGQGGFEHRFSIDGPMSTRDAASTWITKLSSTFRAATYWGAGAVVSVQDAPTSPSRLITNSDVEGGKFTYSGTPISARYTSAVVALQDEDDHNKVKPLISYDDPVAIERYGERNKEISAPFKKSLGEGLRIAKWAVDTDTSQAETVVFDAGFSCEGVRPGDVLLVADKHRIGYRRAGRIVSISQDRQVVTLDAPVSLDASAEVTVWLTDDVGALHQYILTSSGEDLVEIGLSEPIADNIVPGGRFAIEASNIIREYKTLRNTPDHLEKTFKITAIEHDPTKYLRVEEGIIVERDPGHLLPSSGTPERPSGLTLNGFLRPVEGSESKLVLEASWAPHENPLVQAFGIVVKEPGEAWRALPNAVRNNFEWDALGNLAGEYRIRVSAVNAIGQSSGYVEASFNHSANSTILTAPEGWQGFEGIQSIILSGLPVTESAFKAFRFYGAAADDDSLTFLSQDAATTYVRSVPVGDTFTRYRVSYVTHDGAESDLTSFIEVLPRGVTADDLSDEITSDIETAQAQAAQAAQDAQNAQDEVLNVQQDLAETNAELDATNESLTAEAAALRSEIEAAEQSANDHTDAQIVAEATERTTEIGALTNALNTHISEYDGVVAGFSSDLSTLAGDVASVVQSVSTLDASYNTLSASINDLSVATANDIQALTDTQVSQESQIGDLTASYTQQATTLASIEDDLIAVTNTQTTQASQIGTLDATVTQQATTLANLDGTVQAMTWLSAETTTEDGETYVSAIQLVSAADPDGSGSAYMKMTGDLIAPGTMYLGALAVGLGTNLLSNTDFSDGLNGWVLGTSEDQSSETTMTLRAPGQWAGATFPVLQVFQNGAGAGLADVRYRPFITDGTQSRGIPIKAGDWLEARVQLSIHRCTAELRIQYYDYLGVSIDYSPVLASGSNDTGSSTDPDASINPDVWPVYWGKHQAPENSAFATIHLRKRATNEGETNSYLFGHKPQIATSHAEATSAAPYSPGGTTLISGDKVMTGTITAEHMSTESFSVAGLALFGGALSSDNYIGGVSGWYLSKDGTLELQKIIERDAFAPGSIRDGGTLSAYASGGYRADGQNCGSLYTGPWDGENTWFLSVSLRYRSPGYAYGPNNAGEEGDYTIRYRQRQRFQVQMRQLEGGVWSAFETIYTFGYTSSDSYISDQTVIGRFGNFENVQLILVSDVEDDADGTSTTATPNSRDTNDNIDDVVHSAWSIVAG